MNKTEADVVMRAIDRLQGMMQADTDLITQGRVRKELPQVLARRDECFGLVRDLSALVRTELEAKGK